MSTRPYTVAGPSILEFDGTAYLPGDPVELADDIAAALLADGVVLEPETAAQDRKARIIAAIGELDPDNPEHFTKGGKPEVKALEAILGFDITAAERDAAWAAFQEGGE